MEPTNSVPKRLGDFEILREIGRGGMGIVYDMPIAIFVGLLPITVAGMGTRDSAMIVLFSTVASSSQTLSISLLYSVLNYWLLAIIGVPFTARALDWGASRGDEKGEP